MKKKDIAFVIIKIFSLYLILLAIKSLPELVENILSYRSFIVKNFDDPKLIHQIDNIVTLKKTGILVNSLKIVLYLTAGLILAKYNRIIEKIIEKLNIHENEK